MTVMPSRRPHCQATSGHDHEDSDCGHDHGGHASLYADQDDCYVSPSKLKDMVVAWLAHFAHRMRAAIHEANASSRVTPNLNQEMVAQERGMDPAPHSDKDAGGPSLREVIKHVFRYGFVEIADDILFALMPSTEATRIPEEYTPRSASELMSQLLSRNSR